MATTATTIITDVRTLSDTDSATATISDNQVLRAVNSAHEYYYDIIVASDEGYFEEVHTASLVADSRDLNPAVTSTFKKIDLVEVIQSDGDRQPVVPLSAKTEKVLF
jgi:2-phospho-L-lactate guanylyltransferase (CobY/MobA/RfbA family)